MQCQQAMGAELWAGSWKMDPGQESSCLHPPAALEAQGEAKTRQDPGLGVPMSSDGAASTREGAGGLGWSSVATCPWWWPGGHTGTHLTHPNPWVLSVVESPHHARATSTLLAPRRSSKEDLWLLQQQTTSKQSHLILLYFDCTWKQ